MAKTKQESENGSRKRRRQNDSAPLARAGRSSPSWPHTFPVEMFDHILKYLSRSDLKNLRLVSRELEKKVAGSFFHTVAVQFNSELFQAGKGGGQTTSDILLSRGQRILRDFGSHIRRFALCLEIDDDLLSCPPIKPSQRLVLTHWGMYRWPHEQYARYNHFNELEAAADETNAMRDALNRLDHVVELGLYCDAGLGLLLGPESQIVAGHVQQYHYPSTPVGLPRFRDRPRRDTILPPVNPKAYQEGFKSFNELVLERMAADAGYTNSNDAIDLLLKTERTTLQDIDLDERCSPGRGMNFRSPSGNDPEETPQPPDLGVFGDALLDVNLNRPLNSDLPTLPARKFPALVPKSLTRAQKEVLLELEWAHRALIQSFVIATADISLNRSMQNLTSLNIAKIPSSHLPIFCNHALWSNLTQLSHLSIGVLADWRRITRQSPDLVQDFPVSPLTAVPIAYTLLHKYIAPRHNITSLHFEWICGGELAIGSHRDRHILPAPFTETAELQVENEAVTEGPTNTLSLLHVKKLSLKNCWCTPHIFLQVIRTMAAHSLESLELESVSLTGRPTTVPQPPQQFHYYLQLLPDAQVTGFLTQIDPQSVDGFAVRRPDLLTWAGIIDYLSPGIQNKTHLTQVLRDSDLDGELQQQPEPVHPFMTIPRQGPSKLRHLAFKSCGYVAIDAPYINTGSLVLLPWLAQHYRGRHSLPNMQDCRDSLLGWIIPIIADFELEILVQVFEMEIGWANVYDRRTIDLVTAVIPNEPGMGRFSGTLGSS